MFAIIRTGGKQYKVQKDDRILIERHETADGDSIDFSEVLYVNDGKAGTTGAPLVAGASVKARVIKAEARGPKILVFKKKRRQNYRRKRGHRQDLTLVQITDIKAA